MGEIILYFMYLSKSLIFLENIILRSYSALVLSHYRNGSVLVHYGISGGTLLFLHGTPLRIHRYTIVCRLVQHHLSFSTLFFSPILHDLYNCTPKHDPVFYIHVQKHTTSSIQNSLSLSYNFAFYIPISLSFILNSEY